LREICHPYLSAMLLPFTFGPYFHPIQRNASLDHSSYHTTHSPVLNSLPSVTQYRFRLASTLEPETEFSSASFAIIYQNAPCHIPDIFSVLFWAVIPLNFMNMPYCQTEPNLENYVRAIYIYCGVFCGFLHRDSETFYHRFLPLCLPSCMKEYCSRIAFMMFTVFWDVTSWVWQKLIDVSEERSASILRVGANL